MLKWYTGGKDNVAEGVSSAWMDGEKNLHVHLDDAHQVMGEQLHEMVSSSFPLGCGFKGVDTGVDTYSLNHAAYHLTQSQNYPKATLHFNSVERLFFKLAAGAVQTIKRDMQSLVSEYATDSMLSELFPLFRASISSGCFERDPRTIGTQVLCRTEDKDLLDQAEVFLKSCGTMWWKPLRADRGYRNDMVHTLQGHSDKVTSVCYSPDGKTALSGSVDKTVIMWDLESGVKLKVCMYWLLLTQVDFGRPQYVCLLCVLLSRWEDCFKWFCGQDCDHVGPREWYEVKGMYVLVVTYTSRLWKATVGLSPLCATLQMGRLL